MCVVLHNFTDQPMADRCSAMSGCAWSSESPILFTTGVSGAHKVTPDVQKQYRNRAPDGTRYSDPKHDHVMDKTAETLLSVIICSRIIYIKAVGIGVLTHLPPHDLVRGLPTDKENCSPIMDHCSTVRECAGVSDREPSPQY